MKGFEYSQLGLKVIKGQTSIVEKQYQKLDKIFQSADEGKEPVTIEKEEPVKIKKTRNNT